MPLPALEDFRLLFEQSPQPQWVYDLETLRFVAVNDAAVARYGYTREEFLRMSIKDIRPQEDVPALLSNVAGVEIGSPATVSGGWRHRLEDGSLIEVDVSCRPLVFAGRRCELVLPVDVTSRNRREAELRRLATIVEASDDAIIGMTLEGRVTSWNGGAARLYGYSAEEAVGRHASFLVPAEPEMVERFLGKVRAGEPMGRYEAVRHRKDGTPVDVSVTVSVILGEGGEIAGVATIARDVTDRVAATRALAERESHFRSLIENTSDVITVVESDGTIRYANPAVERLLGYRPQELVGSNAFQLVHPDDRAAAGRRFGERLSAPGQPRAAEFRYLHSNGGLRILQTRATVVPEDPPRLVISARDVTEQRELEDQLRQAQKMDAVGRLAGGIAHDFNNLLTSILGYSDLAMLGLRQDDPLLSDLQEIRTAGERAAALTRQLLTFSRKAVAVPQVLDVGTVVTEMTAMLRRLIGDDIDLVTTVAPDSGKVRANRGHVEQVLMNLAVNARDAMGGRGRLTVEVASVELDETYSRQHGVAAGRYVMLAVADTGIGMDAVTQRHLFEPFFTTKEPGSGPGLGLAVVYGIVQQSAGHVGVESQPGQGSTFRVYLPEVESTGEAVVEGSRGEAGAGLPAGTETILLVEDDEHVRAMAFKILAAAGYRVLSAASGSEAEAIVRQAAVPPDLLVTDVIMPKVNGREVADRLRAMLPGLRVLFVSGYTDDAILRSGLPGPGADFLQKPFRSTALATKVRELLDRRG